MHTSPRRRRRQNADNASGQAVSAGQRQRSQRQANLLGALALAIVDRLRVVAAPERRTVSEAAALIHLRLRPGENIDFLARVLALSHPAAVRLVDRLEAAGLVERRTAPDARARALVLTRAGRNAAAHALANRIAVLGEILDMLSAAERQQLEPLLEKLLAGMAGTRWEARHTCRLCDFPTCDDPACPVDRAATDPDDGAFTANAVSG
jgi:MarR family transcriptional regulator, negative regulator of the multidrug operon emrRAB